MNDSEPASNHLNPIVFGASGFVGQHLIQSIGIDKCIPVSRTKKILPSGFIGDLLDLASFKSLLKPGSTVFNLAYSDQASADNNIQMAKNLLKACQDAKVSKLIHCSTALVVGNNSATIVDEKTECYPETSYEITKHTIEKIFLDAANNEFKVYILRPTGVVGSGGQNLKKMFTEICHGNFIINFIRSSLYGKSPLNLVPVQEVVRALLHLHQVPSLTSGVYICAADEDPCNHYEYVEKLIRTLLQKQSRIKSIKLPSQILKTLLRFVRSGSRCHPHRLYSSEKLISTGFKRTVTVPDSVRDFVLSEITS